MIPLSLLNFFTGPIGRWLVIAVLIAAAVAAAGIKGYNAGYAKHEAETSAATAEANQQARTAEREANSRMAKLAAEHHQEKTHAQIQIDRLRADLRSGARRLSIAVARVPACTDPATAAGPGAEARADLDPAAAEALVAIAADGDAAIRQANRLIDAYAIAAEVCGK